LIEDCTFGAGVVVYHPDLVNLYRCTIRAYSTIGPFVEIQADVSVGAFCKVCSHAFLCSGVRLGDRVFVGHGVMFVNDRYPIVQQPGGCSRVMLKTVIEDDVSIGSGAVIMPVHISKGAIVGAGAVVVNNVPEYSIVVGNPAKVIRQFSGRTEWQEFVCQREFV